MKCQIDLIVGTRPNMVKLASLHAALRDSDWCRPRVVFIRQHDMPELGSGLLEELRVGRESVHEIPLPAGDHGSRLGAMISGYALAVAGQRPDLSLVFGDVDATLAGAIAAKRANLPLAHVEAGLRSRDSTMPEEINRRMVDAISDLHFATCADAVVNLKQEGHAASTIHLVGNPMIDALSSHIDRETGVKLCERYELPPRHFGVATFHRPSNVDTPEALERVANALEECAHRLPVWLPMHPRTLQAIQRHGLLERFEGINDLHLAPAHGYVEFIAMLSQARLVLTDSGGLQEEASWLGIPCLTMRQNTERPVTIELGTNRLVDDASLSKELDAVLSSPMPQPAQIPLWDGRAAERIARVLGSWWSAQEEADNDP